MEDVLENFKIYSTLCRIEEIGKGLVHKNYRLVNSGKTKSNYLIQRINGHLFNDVKDVLKETSSIILSETNAKPFSIKVIRTQEGGCFHVDRLGFYWRIFRIPSRLEMEEVNRNPIRSYKWACDFGKFLGCLDNIPFVMGGHNVVDLMGNGTNLDGQITSRVETSRQNQFIYAIRILKQISILEKTLIATRDIGVQLISKDRYEHVELS